MTLGNERQKTLKILAPQSDFEDDLALEYELKDWANEVKARFGSYLQVRVESDDLLISDDCGITVCSDTPYILISFDPENSEQARKAEEARKYVMARYWEYRKDDIELRKFDNPHMC